MKWKKIKEAPFYMVSEEGHVKSCEREVRVSNGEVSYDRHVSETYPLKEKDIRGYKNVSIIQYDENMHSTRRYMRQVHRLVLENFNPIEDMKNFQVNHIDGNKENNHITNLEWVTPKENTIHAHTVLNKERDQNGEKNNMAKLTTEQVVEIIKRTRLIKRESDTKIACDYGVTRKTISNIRRNLTWKHISRDIS